MRADAGLRNQWGALTVGRSARGPRRLRAWCAGITLAAALVAASESRATDIAVLPWGRLVGAAEVVVLGRITRVEHDGAGNDVATIRVDDSFAGRTGRTLRVLGRGSDPAAPLFVRGERVLALLRTPDGSATSRGGATLEPVGGTQGIMPVVDAELAPTRRWVTAMSGAGNTLDLGLLEPLLRRSEPLPSTELLESCLRELDERADDGQRADDALVVDVVCAPDGVHWKRARLWALGAARRRALGAAGGCVAAAAFSPDADPDLRLAALDAVGAIGDARSVPSLLGILGSSPSGELAETAALVLGELGDPAAVDGLHDAGLTGDLRLASTAVHALGLVGGEAAIAALTDIAQRQTPGIRKQAKVTRNRLRRQL